MLRIIMLLALGGFINFVQAQNFELPIGSWKSHLPYTSTQVVAEGAEYVYFATPLALVGVHKEDGSFKYLNKVTGLSDMGVRTIAYHKPTDILFIAYTNSNIDLYRKGKVVNLASIQENENISGSRAINHISFDARYAYLSCDFGLVKLDLFEQEFRETTFMPNVQALYSTRNREELFVSTSKGIYSIAANGTSFSDFSTWRLHGLAEQLPTTYNTQSICAMQDTVFADVNRQIMYFVNDRWAPLSRINRTDNDNVLNPVFSGEPNPRMQLSADSQSIVMGSVGSYRFFNTRGEYYRYYMADGSGVNDALRDANNNFWVAMPEGPARAYEEYPVFNIPNGPSDANGEDMTVDENGRLWVATGSSNNYVCCGYNFNGINTYQAGTWTNYRDNNVAVLEDAFDFVVTAVDPRTQHVFFGTFFEGLFRFDGENFRQYTAGTPGCTLEEGIGSGGAVRVTGLAFDSENNLWMTNFLSNRPLSVLKADSTWESFVPAGSSLLAQIAIDRNDYKWIRNTSSNIIVFDSGDLSTTADDRSVQITASNSVLPTSKVTCITSDRNGSIWAGTNEGIVIFRCGENIFSTDPNNRCLGERPVLSLDNFGAYLLETETINDIAVDGANRKWIATNNGLFLVTADGLEQLAYFSAENSPLFSNRVNSLAIDPQSGTLYISTALGMQAYRTASTEGKLFVQKEAVYAFPNPVRPDYRGSIAITNLVEDANVKITDIHGQLMYETQALGGQAVWDGTNYSGQRASSGVYLVFVVDDSGQKRMVTKLLFMH